MTTTNLSVRFLPDVIDIGFTPAVEGALVKFVIMKRLPVFVIRCIVGVSVSTAVVTVLRSVLTGEKDAVATDEKTR